MKRFIVAGIGTDVGKTIASAVLTEALQATYWKPLQAGGLEHSDRKTVQQLAGPDCYVIDELFLLNTPASPHLAAELDNVKISLADLNFPKLHDHESLVVEMAGGLLVPLNDDGLLFADLITEWKLPVMLVTRHYLGSINHTLLSLSELTHRGITVAGLIINGEQHEPSERIYRTLYPELEFFFLPELKELNQYVISKIGQQWREQLG
ncbi:MAG: dethiobiotin synthase [Fluviicola sp.]|nr:dethiobiotin synthase [Fluviicola sp.]